ncbi:MAG: efflux RND transporter periplasmic adaptor subunit [Verrucomicrobiota bacterium]
MPKALEVDVAPVTRGNLTVTVNHEGKTRIKERYIISSPLAGKMQRIELRAGDPVLAGKTVITEVEPLDPALLDERTRMQAEARVKAAEAAFSRNESLLERARTASEYAGVELERAQALFESKSISHQELDNLEEKKRSADEDLKSAEHGVQIAKYELELARAALLRTSRDRQMVSDEWNLQIFAPISGKVLRVLHEDASVIETGTTLIEVGDPSELEMEVDVLSTDGVKIRPGARVIVENWGGPESLEARVRLVEPAAFTKVSALGVEEQRVNVIADFVGDASKRSALGDAYRIEARIVITELTNVLKIPSAALFKLGDDWQVFRVQNHRAHLQQLGVINISESEAAVTGIEENSSVIIYPSDRISDGKKIANRQKHR